MGHVTQGHTAHNLRIRHDMGRQRGPAVSRRTAQPRNQADTACPLHIEGMRSLRQLQEPRLRPSADHGVLHDTWRGRLLLEPASGRTERRTEHRQALLRNRRRNAKRIQPTFLLAVQVVRAPCRNRKGARRQERADRVSRSRRTDRRTRRAPVRGRRQREAARRCRGCP